MVVCYTYLCLHMSLCLLSIHYFCSGGGGGAAAAVVVVVVGGGGGANSP